jgi:lipoate-protein ligase A
MSIFAALDVYHDKPSRSAALNMAIDEALLELATQPTLRFYQWDHPALSFGYFGRFAEVENEPRDLVRRWTGGGIVFHGEDLTYSLVIPSSDPAFAESSISIYERTHDAIRAALIANGERGVVCCSHAPAARPSQYWQANDDGPQGRGYNENLCFANPVRADVLSNGRKVAGAAQRRTRSGLLQQGSIQNVDLGNGFADLFAKQLCGKYQPIHPDDRLLARAQQIAEQKYATKAWLQRR